MARWTASRGGQLLPRVERILASLKLVNFPRNAVQASFHIYNFHWLRIWFVLHHITRSSSHVTQIFSFGNQRWSYGDKFRVIDSSRVTWTRVAIFMTCDFLIRLTLDLGSNETICDLSEWTLFKHGGLSSKLKLSSWIIYNISKKMRNYSYIHNQLLSAEYSLIIIFLNMFSEVEFLISIGIYWIPYHCSIIFEIIILFSKIGVWFTLLFRDDKIVVMTSCIMTVI